MSDVAFVAAPARHAAADRRIKRVEWVDVARGLGIILVVLGHVWRGLDERNMGKNGEFFRIIDELVYAFHMPLFFFLSGLFLHNTLVSNSLGWFVSTRVSRLIWPLVLWSWIYPTLRMVTGQIDYSPVQLATLAVTPLPPREHFWFLWALFLIQIVALVIRPWATNRNQATVTWLIFLALTTVAYFAVPLDQSTAPWLAGAVAHAPYVALGVLYARAAVRAPSIWLFGAALASFVVSQTIALEVAPSKLLHLLFATIGVVAVITIVRAVAGLWSESLLVRLVERLGLMSMAIYLSHVIFTAATRLILSKLGVGDLTLHILVGTAAGIIGPVMLYGIAQRTGLTRAAGF